MSLPELHLAGWRATKDTLHLYCQIVGMRTADGRTRSFGLAGGMPVAEFDQALHAVLGELDISPATPAWSAWSISPTSAAC